MPVEGGPVTNIVRAENGRGATWSLAGTIVYTPGTRDGLYAVRADGGASPRQLTNPVATGHTSHRWPSFAEDGSHFVYLGMSHDNAGGTNNGIFLASVDRTNKLLLPSVVQAQYVSGRLLYYDSVALLSRKLDLSSGALEGDPVHLSAEGVQMDPDISHGTFSVSLNGHSGLPARRHHRRNRPDLA